MDEEYIGLGLISGIHGWTSDSQPPPPTLLSSPKIIIIDATHTKSCIYDCHDTCMLISCQQASLHPLLALTFTPPLLLHYHYCSAVVFFFFNFQIKSKKQIDNALIRRNLAREYRVKVNKFQVTSDFTITNFHSFLFDGARIHWRSPSHLRGYNAKNHYIFPCRCLRSCIFTPPVSILPSLFFFPHRKWTRFQSVLCGNFRSCFSLFSPVFYTYEFLTLCRLDFSTTVRTR